jgi:hypothetical protein
MGTVHLRGYGREPVTAIREMSSAYIKFAKDNRHLYGVMMSPHVPKHDATLHQSLWTFTVEQVKRIAGSDRAAQASVALWAFLHGAVALEGKCVWLHLERFFSSLRIYDNGVGVDPDIVNRCTQGHFGLQGMRERAERSMGKFSVESSAGSGTVITLTVPGGIIYRTVN